MDTYSALAVAYDTLTAAYDYDRWLAVIEGLAQDAGLSGKRLLDVACGTGSSFLPLIDRYDVTACDLSTAMLEQASLRAGDQPVRLSREDMRNLPVLGEYDLILCLDDSLNHLLTLAEVQAALTGIAANLAAAGVAVFDINTLASMRTGFSSDFVAEDERHLVLWRGQGSPDLAPGRRASAQIDVLSTDGVLYSRETTTLRECHHPIREVTALLDACGLEVAQRLGQSPGVRMEREADERRQGKALFVVRRLVRT
jgi:SAM-dependent methyltransferase